LPALIENQLDVADDNPDENRAIDDDEQPYDETSDAVDSLDRWSRERKAILRRMAGEGSVTPCAACSSDSRESLQCAKDGRLEGRP
jgi:hypothetical protein